MQIIKCWQKRNLSQLLTECQLKTGLPSLFWTEIVTRMINIQLQSCKTSYSTLRNLSSVCQIQFTSSLPPLFGTSRISGLRHWPRSLLPGTIYCRGGRAEVGALGMIIWMIELSSQLEVKFSQGISTSLRDFRKSNLYQVSIPLLPKT